MYKDIFAVIPESDDRFSSPTLYVLDPTKIDYESGVRNYTIIVSDVTNRFCLHVFLLIDE